jgi:hypothetical protein
LCDESLRIASKEGNLTRVRIWLDETSRQGSKDSFIGHLLGRVNRALKDFYLRYNGQSFEMTGFRTSWVAVDLLTS